MFKTVDVWYEPIDIFEKLGERKSELTDKELAFICGIIKEREPKKIVEIGVSAGGTSCVILNCLEKLNMDSKFYSVDISYSYHNNTSKKCGYQITEAKKYLYNVKNHKLFLGKNIADVIDEQIGYDIDMLILDTIHYLPGELLDFLVCFPYLSKDAIVVLDDLTFGHTGENVNAIATKVLYDLIVADKVIPQNEKKYLKMSAFILNRDTRKYVLDYFLGLMTPWWYSLSSNEINTYRGIIKKQYGYEELLLFDEAVVINSESIKKKESIKTEIEKIFEICKSEKNILIYGCGKRGVSLGKFIKQQIGEISGYIISDDRSKEGGLIILMNLYTI